MNLYVGIHVYGLYMCVYVHNSNYGISIEKILEGTTQNANNCLIRKVK